MENRRFGVTNRDIKQTPRSQRIELAQTDRRTHEQIDRQEGWEAGNRKFIAKFN